VLGSSLIHGSPTKCGVSKSHREALIMRRPWPLGAVVPWKKIMLILTADAKIQNYKLNGNTHSSNLICF